MDRSELETAGRAVATAAMSIANALDQDELIALPPETVLAEIEDAQEAYEAGEAWLADKLAELEEAARIVNEDRRRREIDR